MFLKPAELKLQAALIACGVLDGIAAGVAHGVGVGAITAFGLAMAVVVASFACVVAGLVIAETFRKP